MSLALTACGRGCMINHQSRHLAAALLLSYLYYSDVFENDRSLSVWREETTTTTKKNVFVIRKQH